MAEQKIKQKYIGYIVKRNVTYDGVVKEKRVIIGETYATSKAKAINNIKFRHKGRGYNSNTDYGYGDSGIIEYYDAELVG